MQDNSVEVYSRNEILTWINDLLKVNLSRIEQLSSGAVYCQILDIIYPGKVPLSKVNWKARLEYEFVANFKILQQSFLKLNIPKPIDIDRLVKSKYQDNYEFISWMKKFYDSNLPASSKDYNPLLRRNNSEIDLTFLDREKEKASLKLQNGKDSNGKSTFIPPRNSSREPIGNRPLSINKNNSNMSFLSNKENELFEKLRDEKYLHYDVLKAEREFFFGKLRDIDHLLDNFDRNGKVEDVVTAVRRILYNTPDKTIIIGEDGSLKFEGNSDQTLSLKEVNYNNGKSVETHRDDVSMQIE